MKSIESEIKDLIKKLFSEKKIEVFIGYENGTLPLRTTPYFVSPNDDLDKLAWNRFCSNNLAVYLPRVVAKKKGGNSCKVGILCKGCDSRSVVGLIKEKQLSRNDVFIIGIVCPGIIDTKKILSEIKSSDIEHIDEDDENIMVKFKDGKKNFRKKDHLYECCINCEFTTPFVYDTLIGDGKSSSNTITSSQKVAEFSAKSRQERWQIFEQELTKCIRCYACRNACPNCYCKECFAEQTKPKWFSVTNDLSDIIFYHIGRIFHQAGRCVDCGACVRACPMDVDLRLFTRMLVDEVKERFGYDPGLNFEEAPPLTTFASDDKQEFITEPS
ncbi:hypothetical protein A2Y85_07270 [candidate division WOR-3 bacterium RBG_13_43_14]|uniref:4Fe-4S ferredoxin-type domain-containing protein n=1 Tax=candidate division WOR-3 bacterium RBG_13_43_14 TaxID=1802590 RepID=A0A1F4U2V0_UNCW3|nr:MAG: hypothetical protein A2Y85_07270 [candidate division WOR-3 bacterium RBG_13_43_14]